MADPAAARGERNLSVTLRAALARKGMRLEQLASASGVPKATIHRWLSGATASPYFRDRLLNLAATLALTRAETNALLRAADMSPLGQDVERAVEHATSFARWTITARNNLPAELTSLVGRDDDIIDLAMQLSSGPARLLTLTGPGGSGKTRLALRVARELLDAFPDGVWLVRLASARTPDAALATIMRALELPEAGQASPLERLATYLGTRRVLLVLDNLEQVAVLGAEITALLSRAPRLSVLATSRVALRVYGEHLWPVLPLELPDAAPASDAASHVIAPALRLYAERARAVEPSFALVDDRAAVARLCARLDGLPLAIELAAARSARYTPTQLLESFPNRLDVSSDGPLDVDERQRTLRAAIGWSVDLLDDAARRLFEQLAVFTGGCTAEAAEAVYTSTFGPPLRVLVEANLLTFDPRAATPRFQMLETIRDYAAEQLAAEGVMLEQDAHARHADWCLQLATTIPPYAGLRTGQANAHFAVEHDNFAAALGWLLVHEPDAALELAGALWPYWHEAGHFSEGVQWLRAALAPGKTLAPRPRARVLAGLTLLTFSLGDYPDALRLTDETLALAEASGATHEMALVETYRGLMAHLFGDFAAATVWYERGLQHWRAAGEPLGEARCHAELALVAAVAGDFERSASEFDAADVLYRREQNEDGRARSLVDRGLAALMQFNIPEALELLGAAAQRPAIGAFDSNLATAFCYLGIAQLFADDLAAARANLCAALRLFNGAGAKYLVSYCLFGLAGVASAAGQPERAARLCGATFAVQDALGVALAPMVQQLYDLGEATIRATQ